MSAQNVLFEEPVIEVPILPLEEKAKLFCDEAPHRDAPYAARNWGGPLHSLCSYQGKLKPAIAHFLVSWFTERNQTVLDPMAGVGTVPLEARRHGRIAIANDLSPLADSVSRAKIERFDPDEVLELVDALREYILTGPTLAKVPNASHAMFGLNKTIGDYFHPDTLREILIAREFFLRESIDYAAPARDVVRSSLMHILHGNRPYALSRRSHPVTPLAPTGPAVYKSVIDHLAKRLAGVVPLLMELGDPHGKAILGDFRELNEPSVDAVITSPPFSDSFRFWSMNWMRLWFAGWEPEMFKSEPARYLETEQKKTFTPYEEFTAAMARVLKPGGLLIMHLGQTSKVDMAAEIVPIVSERFDIAYVDQECVRDTESHGLTDKGSTLSHQYLFAVRT